MSGTRPTGMPGGRYADPLSAGRTGAIPAPGPEGR